MYNPDSGSIIGGFDTQFSTTTKLSYGNNLLFGANGGITYSYDATTGNLRNTYAAGGNALAYGNNEIFILNLAGGISVFDPWSGNFKRAFSTMFASYSHLTFGEGSIFGTNGGLIYSYDANTGNLVNSFSGAGSGLIYGNDDILYSSISGQINALNPLTGALIHPSFGTNFSNSTQLAFGSNIAPVPEPSTVLFLGSGLLGLAWSRQKRKK